MCFIAFSDGILVGKKPTVIILVSIAYPNPTIPKFLTMFRYRAVLINLRPKPLFYGFACHCIGMCIRVRELSTRKVQQCTRSNGGTTGNVAAIRHSAHMTRRTNSHVPSASEVSSAWLSRPSKKEYT